MIKDALLIIKSFLLSLPLSFKDKEVSKHLKMLNSYCR